MSYDDLEMPVPRRISMTRTGGHAKQLTARGGKQLDRLLAKLQDCDLGDWDADFVDDMTKRMGRYGPEIFLSARQEEQINRLKRQHGLEG